MSFVFILQLDVNIYVSSYHLTFWENDLMPALLLPWNMCSTLNSCAEDGITCVWEMKMRKNYNGHKVWYWKHCFSSQGNLCSSRSPNIFILPKYSSHQAIQWKQIMQNTAFMVLETSQTSQMRIISSHSWECVLKCWDTFNSGQASDGQFLSIELLGSDT